MAPPKYDDISKKISDLFKGFDAGKLVLTLKSKTSNGVGLKVKGTRSNDKGGVSGDIETSGVHSSTGIEWTEKWSTKNVVTTELTMKDLITKGTKVTGEAEFSPKSGLLSSTIKSDFKNNNMFVTSKLSNLKNLTVTASASPLNNVVGGVKAVVKNNQIDSYETTAAYVDTDFFVTSTITSSQRVLGAIYHTPQSNIEAGVKFEYDRSTNAAPTFALASAYKFDSNSELKTSIDGSLKMGVAYKQTLRKGVKAGWFANIDGQNLNNDSHKFGASLELNH